MLVVFLRSQEALKIESANPVTSINLTGENTRLCGRLQYFAADSCINETYDMLINGACELLEA